MLKIIILLTLGIFLVVHWAFLRVRQEADRARIWLHEKLASLSSTECEMTEAEISFVVAVFDDYWSRLNGVPTDPNVDDEWQPGAKINRYVLAELEVTMMPPQEVAEHVFDRFRRRKLMQKTR